MLPYESGLRLTPSASLRCRRAAMLAQEQKVATKPKSTKNPESTKTPKSTTKPKSTEDMKP